MCNRKDIERRLFYIENGCLPVEHNSEKEKIYGQSILHHVIPILRQKEELDKVYERRLTF